jgi:hypothetical protein
MENSIPLRVRGALGNVVAAGPEVAIAVTCIAGLVVTGVASRLEPQLRMAIVLEFVAIHSSVLLGGLVLLRPKGFPGRTLRLIAFVAVCVLYTLIVRSFGKDAVRSFWILTVSTYFGFLVHDPPAERRRLLIRRWIVASCTWFATLIVTVATSAALDIHYPKRTLLFCLYFFGALAAFDLTRFYERVGSSNAGRTSV